MAISLAEFWRPEFAYAVIVTATGGMLQGFAGFGATLVMVPLLSFVYGPAESVAVGIGLSALGFALLIPEASREADWPDVVPASLMSLIFAPAGVYLLLHTDPGITRRLMGAMVILVALIMIRGWNYKGPRNVYTSALCGSFSAFTGGYFGIGAPGVTVYYLSDDIAAAVKRANILIVLCAGSTISLLAVVLGGGADSGSLMRGAALFFPFIIPMWIGARFFRRASSTVYRQVCLWLLIIMGVAVTCV
ncbi:MAG: putative membrane protein YfcA [Gammaproteobacteria bacterium]